MEGSGVGLQLQDIVMLHLNDSKCDDFFFNIYPMPRKKDMKK